MREFYKEENNMSNANGMEVRLLPKVADAYFKIKGQLAFVAKANTAANVNITTQRTDKRGGQDNAIIATVFSDSAVEVGFTSVSWQPEYLAASIGSTIQIRDDLTFNSENLSVAVKDGKITLAEVPADKTVYVEKDGGYVAIPATSTEVEVSNFGFVDDECLTCVMMIQRSGKRIGISTDITPTIGTLTLSSPLFAGTKGRIGTAEYVFPTFQFGGNFDHQFSTDASYALSGQALATASDVCGLGSEFGYYQEYVSDEEAITSFTQIVATPSIMELTLDEAETGTISVFGLKNALYDRIPITSNLVFGTESENITVDASKGIVTPVSATSGTNAVVTVKYNNSLETKVSVSVV